MSHGQSDADLIRADPQHRALLHREPPDRLGAAGRAPSLWGIYGYIQMPKRKDPDVPGALRGGRLHLAGRQRRARSSSWSPARSKQKMAENATRRARSSRSRAPASSIVYVDARRADHRSRPRSSTTSSCGSNSIRDLPPGAGPIEFIKDFGDTAALMLTVASPKVERRSSSSCARATIAQRHRAGRARGRAGGATTAAPRSWSPSRRRSTRADRRAASRPGRAACSTATRLIGDATPLEGPGFVGIDCRRPRPTTRLLAAALQRFVDASGCAPAELHPDVWRPGDHPRSRRRPRRALAAVAGDRYTYRELDEFTDVIQRTLQTRAAGVEGVARRASCPSRSTSTTRRSGWPLRHAADAARRRSSAPATSPLPGGMLEVGGKNAHRSIPPASSRARRRSATSSSARRRRARRVYLRDLVDVIRGYQSPPRFLNYYYRARRRRQLAPQPRASRWPCRCAPASRSATSATRSTPRSAQLAPRLPDDLMLRAHVRPAAAGRRERRAVHAQPLRGHRAGRAGRADRLLGVALGAADGAVRFRSRWR